jgi:nucleotide-binding universal stress UspA family protein
MEMSAYETILCAIDFSDHSRHALRTALALATRGNARVVALHVVDVLLAEAAAEAYNKAQLLKDAETELRALVAGLQAPAAAEPRIVVAVGPPEREVLKCAADQHADLIVMGTQGLGGMRKFLFGSVTEKVLRETHVPVLAVPLKAGADAAADGSFSSVIAGVDLEGPDDLVASHAATLAAYLGVPLTLVHAVPELQSAPPLAGAADTAATIRRADAERRVTALAATLPASVAVRWEVTAGAPAAELAERAAGEPNAIIVIGLGGRRLFHRPGSTAYRVFCLSAAPVLAVPEHRPAVAE